MTTHIFNRANTRLSNPSSLPVLTGFSLLEELLPAYLPKDNHSFWGKLVLFSFEHSESGVCPLHPVAPLVRIPAASGDQPRRPLLLALTLRPKWKTKPNYFKISIFRIPGNIFLTFFFFFSWSSQKPHADIARGTFYCEKEKFHGALCRAIKILWVSLIFIYYFFFWIFPSGASLCSVSSLCHCSGITWSESSNSSAAFVLKNLQSVINGAGTRVCYSCLHFVLNVADVLRVSHISAVWGEC